MFSYLLHLYAYSIIIVVRCYVQVGSIQTVSSHNFVQFQNIQRYIIPAEFQIVLKIITKRKI